jgi:hypothetical protein
MLAGWLLACEGKVSQRVEHPELMQAQLEFDQVKKNRAAELQVGPSVVDVLSECSSPLAPICGIASRVMSSVKVVWMFSVDVKQSRYYRCSMMCWSYRSLNQCL